MTWTTDKIAELKRLWDMGLPTSEIARRMGMTKGKAIGKVHRLQLQGLLARRGHILSGRALLPAAELIQRQRDRARRWAKLNRDRVRERANAHYHKNKVSLHQTIREMPETVELHPTRTCQHIVNGEGRHAEFCGQPALVNSPWCPDCYVRLTIPVKSKAALQAGREAA